MICRFSGFWLRVVVFVLAVSILKSLGDEDRNLDIQKELDKVYELRRKGEVEAAANAGLKIARNAGNDERGNILGQVVIDLSLIPERETETKEVLSQIVGPAADLTVSPWVLLHAYEAKIHLGDLNGAIKILLPFLKEYPYRDHNSAYAYLDLVDCIAATQTTQAAVPVAEKLIQTYTSRKMNTYGRLDNAKVLIKPLREYPGDGKIKTLREYGDLFAKNRLFETAKVAYRQAFQQTSDPAIVAELSSKIGDMHAERFDYLRAAQCYEQVFTTSNQLVYGLKAVRLMSRYKSDFSEMEKIIRRATMIVATNDFLEQMRYLISFAYYSRRNNALSALHHLTAMKGNSESKRLEVECLLFEKEYAKALKLLQQMPTMYPSDSECGVALSEYETFIKNKTDFCVKQLQIKDAKGKIAPLSESQQEGEAADGR